jgi:hypothetical protein
MPAFVGVLAAPDHVFEYVNDAYVEISARTDFVGKTVRQVFPELEGQGFFELLDQVYATGKAVVTPAMELRLAGSDDVQFIDFVYQPIRDEGGHVRVRSSVRYGAQAVDLETATPAAANTMTRA